MKPSDRVLGLNGPSGSDGWEILFQARALKDEGQPVIDLTIGDHDRTTPAPLIDAMTASARGGNTGYAAISGAPELREAIARRVQHRTGVSTTAANVMVTPGGQAALFAALMATLDPGDVALTLDPQYATYPGTVRAASGQPVALPTRAEAGFHPQAQDLSKAPPARALLINTPNNPTGAVYGPATLLTIADFATQRDLWLISDEVYDGQVWDGAHRSPRALPGMQDRTLVIGSLSKSHVMTGWRLGWIIGPPAIIERVSTLAISTTYGVAGFIQDAALEALTRGDAIEAEVTETYRSRRTAALETLAGQNDLAVVPAQGGMYVMLDIRRTGLSGRDFAQGLLDKHGVAVMPGESFGTATAGHLRIALTQPTDDLIPALTTLMAYAKDLS